MKILLVAGALAASFVAGAGVTRLYYLAEMADQTASYAKAAQDYQAELKKKGEDYEKRLAQAADAKQAEIDRLNGDLVSMRSDVDRLRVAAAGRRTVSGTKSSAGKSGERQDGSCIRLLAEGAGLLEEGSGLLRELNADREGIRKLK